MPIGLELSFFMVTLELHLWQSIDRWPHLDRCIVIRLIVQIDKLLKLAHVLHLRCRLTYPMRLIIAVQL